MNVLITTPLFPPDIGGPATYAKLLADELPKQGVHVDVLSFGGIRHLPQGIRHAVYAWMVLRRGRGADVIYAQDPLGIGLPSVLAAAVLRKKFLLKVVGDRAWETMVNQESRIRNHGSVGAFVDPVVFDPKKYDFSIRLRHFVQRFVARRARMVVVPSEYLKQVVLRWGVDGGKIQTIHNAFDATGAEVTKEEARERLGLRGTVIVSVGRLVPWKGFRTLIRIMPDVLHNIPDAVLCIVGSGPEEYALRSAIREAGLDGSVKLIGQVPHEGLLLYLRAGDVFVLNTGYEGLSHVLLEAMAMEIPIITTNVGGNPEVVENGETGLLVGYNNGEGILRAIRHLFEDRALRDRMVSNARLRTRHFSRERMIGRTLKLLQAL